MSYLVTARKWRPDVFEDVIGQEHVTKTLQNAISQNRIAHAYIFSGPRGCGKTTTARLLAKAINCTNRKGFNPCNECPHCVEITEGRSVDVFEIDGASNNSVDDVRTLQDTVHYAPTRTKYKVYIIDEVHMLSKGAFNALLKTLEEPPPFLFFIFATTEIHKVPATILSRCQRFDFRRNSLEEIIARLKFIATEESISIDDDALLIIAKKSDGSMRDSQSIFDQLVALSGNTIRGEQVRQSLNIVDTELYFKITDCILSKNIPAGLALVEDVVSAGYDFRELFRGLAEHFRNLLVMASTQSTALIEATEDTKKRYEELAKHFSENDLLRYLKLTIDLENDLRFSPVPRFRVELGIAQMVKMERSVTIEQLLHQLEELKRGAPTFSSKEPAQKYSFSPPPATFEKKETRFPATITLDAPQKNMIMREPSFAGTPVKQNPQIRMDGSPVMKQFSVSDVVSTWPQVVNEVQKEKRIFGSILADSKVVKFDNGLLTLACKDDIQLKTLKQNQDVVHSALEKIYGMKFRFESILVRDASSSQDRQTEQEAEHPLIQDLKRELGAIALDE